MNKTMQNLKIVLNIPNKYLQARKAIKENDEKTGDEIVKYLSKKVIKDLNREIEIINLNENLKLEGSLIISNHQENFDIFALVAAFEEKIRFVAKKELFQIFMFKTYLKLNKSYSLNRNDAREGVKVFKTVVNDINNENANVVIFPEGTRSKCDVMNEFNSGLFSFFKKVEKPIIPVYIDGSYDDTRKKVKIIIGKPIYNNELTKNQQLKDVVYDAICELKKRYANSPKYNILGLGDSITFGQMHDGTYGKGYYDFFIEKLKKESVLGNEYNLSIPSFSCNDFNSLINNNDYENRIKQVELDEDYLNKLVSKNDKDVHELIKESDYLLLSIGSNDIFNNINSIKVDKDMIYDAYEIMYQKLIVLIEKINKINKYIKIIYIGQYFPYPHSKTLLKFDYIKALDLYINRLEIKFKNFNKVIISKEIFDNKDTFLPNKRDIHLSSEGYQFVYTKVLEVFIKKLRIEHGYK